MQKYRVLLRIGCLFKLLKYYLNKARFLFEKQQPRTDLNNTGREIMARVKYYIFESGKNIYLIKKVFQTKLNKRKLTYHL